MSGRHRWEQDDRRVWDFGLTSGPTETNGDIAILSARQAGGRRWQDGMVSCFSPLGSPGRLTCFFQGKETGDHGGIVRQKDTGYVPHPPIF